MMATAFELTDEPRESSIGLATLESFQLQKSVDVSAQEILENPNMSLYCLDFQNRRAVFVELPSILTCPLPLSTSWHNLRMRVRPLSTIPSRTFSRNW